MSDIATALSDCVTRDGQSPPTVNIPMGGFRITGLGNGTARTDAVNAGQIQDGGLTTLAAVAGTDTVTASSAPITTAYTLGQTFDFIPAGTNTTNAVTININALGAKSITKFGALALSPGDLTATESVRIRYDGTQFQVISPLVPVVPQGLVNRLVNGNFDFIQRGTTFTNAATAANAYTADMWQVARATFAPGYTASIVTTNVPSGSQRALKVQRTAGDTSNQPIQFGQALETVDIIKFQGKEVTFSYQIFASGAFIGMSFNTQIFFGTGTDGNVVGGFAAAFGTITQANTLTSSYQTVSLSFTVPLTATQMGVAGTISPTTTAAGASDFFQVAQCQLNDGGSALPFERREVAVEQPICERYYRTIGAMTFASYGAAGGAVSLPLTFPSMRTTPSASFAGTPAYINASAATLSNITPNTFALGATTTALGGFIVNTNGLIILNATP